MFIKVNIGIAPQFELIRRASSFWCLFCGFEPTVFCSDPVLPSWRETLSIYGPLTGALAAHNGFIALSCSPLNSVCITISLSLSASGSSLSLTPQLPHFSLSGLVCCMCSPLINEPSTWTDEEKLMKPTWHLSKLFPLTYLSFFFFPLCDSFSFFYSEAPVSQRLLSFPLSTVL